MGWAFFLKPNCKANNLILDHRNQSSSSMILLQCCDGWLMDDIDPAHVWRYFPPPGCCMTESLRRFLCFFVPCPSSDRGSRVMLRRHRLWWSVNMSEYTAQGIYSSGDLKPGSQSRGLGGEGLATKTGRGGEASDTHNTKCQPEYFLSCSSYQFPSTNNLSCFHLPGQVKLHTHGHVLAVVRGP